MSPDAPLTAAPLPVEAPTAASHLAIGIGPLIAGIVVVLLLIGAVVYGYRRRARNKDRPPRAHARPRHARTAARNGTSARETDGVSRESHDAAPAAGVKDMGEYGTRPGDSDEPPPWDEGKSGSFGNG
ncbi:DUF6479 family protein [Streptomyces chrestomyceticus]|uniref:Secreted protein n=1 Tax=Streptomyces chrestomyceticus JCM 4735 TaxID=1306181 RepID=A0A7U9KPM1_9ACTN|nr:DUF6479 family protein [Streptomyces chrestomyceticus]GCD33049.1 hypothetical protein OEIGOIKO_00768 [Streptomyces chrestomyceticus JCM 4735]